MKKIASKYVSEDTGEQLVYIEVNVDKLDEEQELRVQSAVEELIRYILRMKGIISPECDSCSGC